MNILYTAFKGKYNASNYLIAGMQGDTLFLTNSFQELERDIASIDEHYDAVLMFGVAPELRDTVRVETCALYIGEYITTDFEIEALTGGLQSCGIPCFVSDKPTAYLCNAAYYHMLKRIPGSVFVHIPSIQYMNTAMMEKLSVFLSRNPWQ